jgi:predicted TIM-barrel fold metal-dependent hydrolase
MSVQSATRIVDTHQHLWDLSRFRPPWLAGADPVLRQSHVTSDYLAAAEGLGIVKSVYMEIDVDPSQQAAEAEHLIGLCQSGEHPTVAAVISGRPAERPFDAYLDRFRTSQYIKGVRQVLHSPSTPPGFCLQPAFVRGIQRLGELGWSFDLCMRPGELPDAARLAQLCPGTRFILDHCGNADPKAFLNQIPDGEPTPEHQADTWRRDLAEVAARPNVVCKISGIVARAPRAWRAEQLAPIVNHCLECFGDERVMFGSDWPVCRLRATLRQWVEALREIVSELPESRQRQLFHDNAVRYYGLQ